MTDAMNGMMNNLIDEYFINKAGISKKILDIVREAEYELAGRFEGFDAIAEFNQYKVINAMQQNGLADMHFTWSTGYGYDDAGRDAAERIYADLFAAEAALVRPTIVSGTHALNLLFSGILRPGDEMVYCTGAPYDTLEVVIGKRGSGMGSLTDFGICYKEVPLKDGRPDYDAILKQVTSNTRMCCLQRSTGYSWREAFTVEEISEWVKFIKSIDPNIICMVDNCYGEFVDCKEPTEAGADIIAGSLIKNPGGGLALAGGYIAGKKDLVESISYRLTAPGIGGECGLTFGQTRNVLQGLFIAPQTVKGAVKGAVLCGKVFEKLGYETCPASTAARGDIIQAIKLKTPEAVIAFCKGIQSAAPVNSNVTPLPWDMPGYDDEVIMAAGAFVQGSSIELSADAPMREPYIVYFQGGLTYEHSKLGVIKALHHLAEKGEIGI